MMSLGLYVGGNFKTEGDLKITNKNIQITESSHGSILPSFGERMDAVIILA